MTRLIVSPLRVGDDIGSGTASKTLLRLPINEMLTDAPEAAKYTHESYAACAPMMDKTRFVAWL
jgi:hypothetical protein